MSNPRLPQGRKTMPPKLGRVPMSPSATGSAFSAKKVGLDLSGNADPMNSGRPANAGAYVNKSQARQKVFSAIPDESVQF